MDKDEINYADYLGDMSDDNKNDKNG